MQLSAAQALDRVISEALSWIQIGKPDVTQLYDEELLDLANKFQCFTLSDNILDINLPQKEVKFHLWQTKKIVVPLVYRQDVIASAHKSLVARNLQSKTTLYRIIATFYWYNLESDVITYIACCVDCNIHRPKLNPYSGPHSFLDNQIF